MFSKALLIVAVAAFVLDLAFSTSVPAPDPDLKDCKSGSKNFDDCLKKYIQANIQKRSKKGGISLPGGGHDDLYHLNLKQSMKMQDIILQDISCKGKEDSVFFPFLSFNQVYIDGLEQANITEIYPHIEEYKFWATFHIDGNVQIIGDYNSKITYKSDAVNDHGEVQGKFNITLVRPTLEVSELKGTPVNKGGKTYMKVESVKSIVLKDDRSQLVQLDNVFKGNAETREKVNHILDTSKWFLVEYKIVPAIQRALANTLIRIANEVFSKYPYEEFFTGKRIQSRESKIGRY